MTPKAKEASSALIVGGTAGIAYASAQALLAHGIPKVTIVGRSRDRGEATCAGLSEQFPKAAIFYAQCDARNAEAMQTAADDAARRMGSIDILLSCGGGDPMPKLLYEIPISEVMPTISMIVAGIIHPARAVQPHMTAQGSGSIICLASDAAKIATPGETVIGAAMAAIVMFCRGMAYEAKRNGIRVNCLTPSIVQGTPLYDKLMSDAFSKRLFGKAETLASLGVVTPEDLAAWVVFLASPAAAKITGQTISITGGISAV